MTKDIEKGYTSPKTKIGQHKMEVLVASAEELFAEKGFYDTSVADICKQFIGRTFPKLSSVPINPSERKSFPCRRKP